MHTVVVVPAFNEEKTVGAVVHSLRSFVDNVIVVNDGSHDRTAVIAAENGARVLTHCINRGLGAAIATGIVAALQDGAEIIITFDADGQHKSEDIPRLIASLEEGTADIVLGIRTTLREKMPLKRRFANWMGNALTFLLFGMWVSDSQSGLRAFSRRAAEELDLKCDRMEVSSEIVKEIKTHGWRLIEVPIIPIYTEYSLSKGQNFFVGLKTAGKLLLRRLMMK